MQAMAELAAKSLAAVSAGAPVSGDKQSGLVDFLCRRRRTSLGRGTLLRHVIRVFFKAAVAKSRELSAAGAGSRQQAA